MQRPKTITNALGLELNKSRFMSGKELSPWLRVEYKIDELINEFWGIQTRSNLIAVSGALDNKQWKGLVSEWNSFGSQPGQFRLNESLVKNVLEQSLGQSVLAFNLKEITMLEMSLFENFFVALENFWRDYWRVSEANSQGNLNFLVWVIELENQEIGSMAIGVPAGVIPKEIFETRSAINIRQLARELNVAAPLDLSAGKTRLSINEIKNLEAGDLLIFEESDTSHFIWSKNELNQVAFRLLIPERNDPRWAERFLDDLEIGEMIEEQNLNDDILADLPIELTAQFKGVNMPLQKVMELEAGGVLPLGLLLDSELVLMAPGNKAIAQGELVIVGNQFGLKIGKINLKSASGEIAQAKLSAAPEIDSNLLDRAMLPATHNPAIQEHHSQANGEHYDDEMDDGEEEQQKRMTKEDINDLSKQIDQELEDIGIDPSELDELDDLGDDDDF